MLPHLRTSFPYAYICIKNLTRLIMDIMLTRRALLITLYPSVEVRWVSYIMLLLWVLFLDD